MIISKILGGKIMIDMFIKSISFDDQKRIIISVQEHLVEYLKEPESRKMLKETVAKALEEDFVSLEIAKTSCRVTVTEGKEDECKVKIESEIAKAIEFAMNFMNNMNQDKE